MSGDEYYIKLLDNNRKVLWENYIWMKEENTKDYLDYTFTGIIKAYLPQEKFKNETSVMKVYGIAPSVGDLVLLREIDIAKYKERNDVPKVNTYVPSVSTSVPGVSTSVPGVSTDVPGVKYDDNKPLAGDCLTIFGRAIMAVGECILKGQEKYPAIDNWKRVKDAKRRYTNALIRHLIKHLAGKKIDEESGLTHIQHVAWNALAVCELCLEEKG